MIEFRFEEHTRRKNETVVEVWHNKQFVATIVGDEEGAELRLISKWPLTYEVDPGRGPNMLRLKIGVK